jgi:hypothetical protein
MCGRFSASFSFRETKVRWNLYGDFEFTPRYNIAPSRTRTSQSDDFFLK